MALGLCQFIKVWDRSVGLLWRNMICFRIYVVDRSQTLSLNSSWVSVLLGEALLPLIVFTSQTQWSRHDSSSVSSATFTLLCMTWLIDRCGSPTEEPSGGERRSCGTRGNPEVGHPVARHTLHWPPPSIRPSIISSLATAQVHPVIYVSQWRRF